MGFARTLATVAFIIALPIALISTNVRILANAPLVYRYAFDRYDAESSTGLSRADLNSTAASLRDYFNNDEKSFYHTVTRGRAADVRVQCARDAAHAGREAALPRRQPGAGAVVVYVLAYVVAMFVWWREGSLRQLAAQCLGGLALGALFVGGVAIFAAFGFQSAFDRFHGLLFSSGSWEFNPDTDHLVQMFPEPFWRDMTVLLGLMCAAEAAVIGVVSGVYLLGTRGERRQLPASVAIDRSQTQAI